MTGSGAGGSPSGGVKVTIWIPVEQVGVVIGRSGQQINRIQSTCSARLTVSAGEDKKSLWAPVAIKGSPDGAFQAAQLVTEIVEEVDDAVAEFQLGPKARSSLLVDNDELGAAVKRVSAECNVRIRVPAEVGEAVTLEGITIDVKNALDMLVAVSQGKDPFAPKEVKTTVQVPSKCMRGRAARRGQQQPLYRLIARASGTHISKLPKAGQHGNDRRGGDSTDEDDEDGAAGGGGGGAKVAFSVRGPEINVEAVTKALRSIADGENPKDVLAALKNQFPPSPSKTSTTKAATTKNAKEQPASAHAPSATPAKQEKPPKSSKRNKRGGTSNNDGPAASPAPANKSSSGGANPEAPLPAKSPSPATAPQDDGQHTQAAKAAPGPAPTDAAAKPSPSSQRSRRSRGGRRRASGGGGGSETKTAAVSSSETTKEQQPSPALAAAVRVETGALEKL